jgi:hypothetical protein
MTGGAIGDVQSSGRGSGTERTGPDQLRVLVFARGDDGDPGVPRLVGAMLERDHEVVVAVNGDKALPQAERRALAELAARNPDLDQVRIPARRDPWRIPAGAIRRSLDYLRCLEPEQSEPAGLTDRARERAPRLLLRLLSMPPFRWAFGRRALAWYLRRVEAGLPIARAPKALIGEHSPDVVVVSAAAELGAPKTEFVRAAQAKGTPSVLVIEAVDASDPARLRDVPSLAVVANQARVNDVVRIQRIPRDRVEAVGGETVDGAELPSPGGVVTAVDEAARSREGTRPPGRILRPVLWLTTPLMVPVVPLLRLRATIRETRKRRRFARKRALEARKTRRQEQAASHKAQAQAAKEEKRSRVETAKAAKAQKRSEVETSRQRKIARAAEKQQKRERRASGEHRSSKRDEHRDEGTKPRGEAADDGPESGG